MKGGWAGPIALRLERDVIAFRPTVVTIMLGMNDGGYKPFDPVTLSSFGEGYRAIVDRLREALPGVRLTIIRPSPFDDVSRKPQFAPGYDDTLRRLGCYATSLAQGPSMTTADFRTPLNAGLATLVAVDPALAQLLLPDRVHPSAGRPPGDGSDSAASLERLGAGQPRRAGRDDKDGRGRGEDDRQRARRGRREGSVGRSSTRRCPCHSASTTPTSRSRRRPGPTSRTSTASRSFVRGLPAGRYELRIDGQAIATFDDGELATGVNLAVFNTPQRWQAYAVRWSVADSHELQRVRRRLMASAPVSPQTQQTIDALTALDVAARRTRREAAQPRPRQYELVPR